VRVTTAFNRVLGLDGAWVTAVEFTDAGIVISVHSRTKVHRCPCGWRTRARYDVSRRRWRHLDFGASRVWIEADLARIDCHACERVRTEEVTWARPGARHSRDFEQVIGWLAQRMDKTAIKTLMRCSWEAVDAAVKRLVVDHLVDERLDGLYRIGLDEISYKRGHTYLTVIADHDSARVVWVGKTRSRKPVDDFVDALGPERAKLITAVTMDASSAFLPVAADRLPKATVCLDPFHIMKWVNEALDKVYQSPGGPSMVTGTKNNTEVQANRRTWARTRTALRTGAERLDTEQQNLVNSLRRNRYRIWRAWEMKETFREFYRSVEPEDARAYLKAWCTTALRSRIPAFRNLVKSIRRNFDAIAAAVELGLSNSRLEGINTKIRVIQRRGYGHSDPDALTAMIHLCLGGITLTLPGRP
jgi:transposase